MRFRKLLIAITLCLSLSVVVSAHPGRTDQNGGHTDHNTGEYHYHHGYPAHQHYDMDGDGRLDCPYLFDDKTGSSGNKSESSGTKTESQRKQPRKKLPKTGSRTFSTSLWLWVLCFFPAY